MSGLGDPHPSDWEAFRAARDRFFARVRPEAMDDPPPSICPDVPPEEWKAVADDGRSEPNGPDG